MKKYRFGNTVCTVDYLGGSVANVTVRGKSLAILRTPLFRVGMRDEQGNQTVADAFSAGTVTETETGAVYTDFAKMPALKVNITATTEDEQLCWHCACDNAIGNLIEWVDCPLVSLPAPKTGESAILTPYNEGAIVDDLARRQEFGFGHREIEYPSLGCYHVFPNMICSQFLCYLTTDGEGQPCGLYFGAHDERRGLKGIDFFAAGEDSVTMQFRLFSGVNTGDSFAPEYAVVWQDFSGTWEAGAAIYREWFESHLPPRVTKLSEKSEVPDWYEDATIVVTYPVRGIHDMDEMKPNALFPYSNALPLIDNIAERTGARILTLLMHWEGTAPWAPPYVWPPYGGEQPFFDFMDALHRRGHLLGVYCSGFGYTMQSNLIDECNNSAEFEREHLQDAVCAGPDGAVQISKICTGQRAGYDLCPANRQAQEILNRAYLPLLRSGVDYIQILDQNHGGGQYLCYAKNHGHPHAPGAWMTENMQSLLSSWNAVASKTLLGCESAAAEPFIGNLKMSDNRFELNWLSGRPVPLYAFLYHEYVRNFMGNQVCCPFPAEEDTLCFRLAYSFVAGDCMTVVCTPDGKFLPNWGGRDFTHLPDMDRILTLMHNLTDFYRNEGKPYLSRGRMLPARPVLCETIPSTVYGYSTPQPVIYSTAWQTADDNAAQILCNHTDNEQRCTVDGKPYTVPALSAMLIPME